MPPDSSLCGLFQEGSLPTARLPTNRGYEHQIGQMVEPYGDRALNCSANFTSKSSCTFRNNSLELIRSKCTCWPKESQFRNAVGQGHLVCEAKVRIQFADGHNKNRAGSNSVCPRESSAWNRAQSSRSRLPKTSGEISILMYESKPCDYFQICATRTSRATALILRSITMTPKSALASKDELQAI
jgi:hypothetical protein